MSMLPKIYENPNCTGYPILLCMPLPLDVFISFFRLRYTIPLKQPICDTLVGATEKNRQI